MGAILYRYASALNWPISITCTNHSNLLLLIYCDVLPKSLKAGISEAALFTRQHTAFTQQHIWSKAFPLQRNYWTRCCLSSPPRGYLRESIPEFQIW
jgi:hypothetical protein